MSAIKPLATLRRVMGNEPKPGHGPWEEANSGYVDAKPYVGHTRNGVFVGYDDSIWKYYRLPEDVQIDWLARESDVIESQHFFLDTCREFGEMLDAQPEKLRNDVRRPWHLQITQTPSKELQPYPGCTPAHADYLSRFSSQITKPIWHGVFGVRILPGAVFYESHGFKAQLERYVEILRDPGALQWQIYAQDMDQTDAVMARNGFRSIDFAADPELFEQITAWHGVSDITYGLPQQLQNTRFQEPVHGLSLITPKWGEVTFHALKPHESYNISDPQAERSRWAVPLFSPTQQVVLINMRGEIRAPSITDNLLDLKKIQRTSRKGTPEGGNDVLSQLDLIAATREIVDKVHLPMLDNVEIIIGSRVPEDGSPHPLPPAMKKYGLMAAPLVSRQHLALLASTPTYPRPVARIPRGSRKRPDLVNVMMPGVLAMSGVFRSTKPCADGGILVGLGDSSFQFPEIYTKPDGHYENNRTPGWLITGRPGAGKALSLDTPVMTPEGPVPMGDLKVGDTVFGSDGKPCQVTFATEVMTEHEVFRITLSDGQTFLADADHQWVVQNQSDRYHYAKRDNSYVEAKTARAERNYSALLAAANSASPSDEIKLMPLVELLQDLLGEDTPWTTSSPVSVRNALEFTDCPYRVVSKRARVYPLGVALKCLADRVAQQAPRPAAGGVPTTRMTTREMYDAGVSLLDASGQRHGDAYSIPLAGAVEYPHRDLLVDPYVLGAWLGDGSRGAGKIASAAIGRNVADESGVSDQAHMLAQVQQYYPSARAISDYVISVPGLLADLRAIGVAEFKSVPEDYLYASAAQRLALLQGLMDTDGGVTTDGAVRFTNANINLAEAVVELARSLGHKVNWSGRPSTCTCGRRCECYYPIDPSSSLSVESGGWTKQQPFHVQFSADAPVFRLRRKVTSQNLQPGSRVRTRTIRSIDAVPSVPVRCISVDNADSTYLVGGSVPTSNTQQLLQIVSQLSYMGLPSFFLNPKREKTLQPTFDHVGGHTISMSRAYLEHHPGQLDPCFFISNRKEVAQILAGAIFTAGQMYGNQPGAAQRRAQIEMELGDRATDLRNTCSAHIIFGNNHADPTMRTSPIGDAEVRSFVSNKMKISPFWTALISTVDSSSELQSKMNQGRSVLVEWDSSMTLPPLDKDPEKYTDSESDTVLSVTLVFQYGSAYIRGTGGAMIVDESWVLRASREARAILTRGGREWRQASIMLILGTQNITDWLGESAGADGGTPMDSFFDRYLFMAISEGSEAELDAFFRYSGLPRTKANEDYIRNAGVDVRRDGKRGRSIPVAYYVDRVHNWAGGVICGPWPALELNLGRTDKIGEATRAAKAQSRAAVRDAEDAKASRKMFGGSITAVLDDQQRLDAEAEMPVGAEA